MGKYKIRVLMALAAMLAVSVCPALWAETQPLKRALESISVSEQNQDSYKLSVAETEKLVEAGNCKAAVNAFNKLKTDFPEIIMPDSNDLDMFIEAEILLCQGKLAKAARHYGKLLDEIPAGSRFYLPALERQFEISSPCKLFIATMHTKPSFMFSIFFKLSFPFSNTTCPFLTMIDKS